MRCDGCGVECGFELGRIGRGKTYLLSRKRLSRACGSIDWKIYVRTAWGARNPTHLRVHGQQSVSIFKWRGALQGGEAASIESSSIHADVDVSLLVAPARVCRRGQRALGGAAYHRSSGGPQAVQRRHRDARLMLCYVMLWVAAARYAV